MAQSISNLKVGDKVKFTRYGLEGSPIEEVIRLIAGHNHYRDDLNPNIVDHVTLIPWKIQDLRGFDAKEPNNSDSNRKTNGNNRYKDSNIRQWLNKSGKPWFVKTHTADEPPTDAGMSEPTGYDDIEGYLSFLTEEELNALVPTNIRVAKNTVTDGGGSEIVQDLFFLPSTTELGLANENSIAEGALLPLFSDDASRIAYLTPQCFDNTKSASKPATINDAWHYWLRTPFSSGSCAVRRVYASGALGGDSACGGNYGVRPLCNLKSDILVSDLPDEDGCYNIIFAVPHIITLNKAITINAGDKLERIKFNPKVNGEEMWLHTTDTEKLILRKENLDTDTVDLEIEGKDGKIDKIAYTIS